jgi:hypothetical protein
MQSHFHPDTNSLLSNDGTQLPPTPVIALSNLTSYPRSDRRKLANRIIRSVCLFNCPTEENPRGEMYPPIL